MCALNNTINDKTGKPHHATHDATGNQTSDTFACGSGNDILTGNASNDTIDGSDGVDTIDLLTGGNGTKTYYGNDGNYFTVASCQAGSATSARRNSCAARLMPISMTRRKLGSAGRAVRIMLENGMSIARRAKWMAGVVLPVLIALVFIFWVDFLWPSASRRSCSRCQSTRWHVRWRYTFCSGRVFDCRAKNVEAYFIDPPSTTVQQFYLRTTPSTTKAIKWELSSLWRAGYVVPVAWFYLSPSSRCSIWVQSSLDINSICHKVKNYNYAHETTLIRSGERQLANNVVDFPLEDRELLDGPEEHGWGVGRSGNEVDWIFGRFYLVRLYPRP
jgi:RTX calcium-binding nonapeptide repeat (4 copies)